MEQVAAREDIFREDVRQGRVLPSDLPALSQEARVPTEMAAMLQRSARPVPAWLLQLSSAEAPRPAQPSATG